MNGIFRFLYILAGPASALVIGAQLTALLSLNRGPENPLQKLISTSSVKFLSADRKNVLYLFHGNVFVASRLIEEGKPIEAKALEREDFGGLHLVNPRLKYVDQQVTGRIASRDIPKGKPIIAEDLATVADQTKLANGQESSTKMRSSSFEKDNDVTSGSYQHELFSSVLFALAIAAALGGAVVFCIGYILVIVEAFKTSMFWGLGSIFIPFCKTVFEIKNWQVAKRPLLLMTIGSFLCGTVMGSAIALTRQEPRTEKLRQLIEVAERKTS